MAEETLTITIGQELISEIDDDRIAGAKSERPLEREEAVPRLVKAGDEALVEESAHEFTTSESPARAAVAGAQRAFFASNAVSGRA